VVEIRETVLVADRDPRTRAEVRELLRPYKSVTVIDAPDGRNILDQINELQPQLVILDVSLPGVNGYDLCLQIKRLRSDATRVILLNHEGETFDESRVKGSRCDAELSAPLSEKLGAKKVLTHHLFVRGTLTSLKSLTIETRRTLDLLSHRVAVVLEEEFVETISLDQILGGPQRPTLPALKALVKAKYSALMRKGNPEFVFRFVSRALDEVPGILWTEIKEQIIVDSACEVNDIGLFTKSFIRGLPAISFSAGDLLVSQTLPYIDYRVSSPLTLAALRACHRALRPHLAEFIAYGGSSAAVLAMALPNFLVEFDNQVADLHLDLESPQLTTSQWADWIVLDSEAISFSVFYFYLCEWSQSLHRSGRFDVETVGKFELRNDGVTFEPSPHLINLIEANPMSRTAAAG
jgi:CheY-like chemotaxis protein